MPKNTIDAFHRGTTRPRSKGGRSQSHSGVSPLHPVSHRNTSFQPLPRALNLPPYRYDLTEKFPAIGAKIHKAGQLTFHVLGDTGGIKDAKYQLQVAHAMSQDLAEGADAPQFAYHVGDVVYFTGAITDYYDQFYEAYAEYAAPIFSIPGNHDGEVDDPSTQTSLDGWVRYFMQANPDVDPISKDAPRVQLDLPNVYWTLKTEFATLVGLYTNVPEHGSIDSVQQQWVTNEFAEADEDKALILSLHHPIYSFDNHQSGSSRMADVLENAIRDTGRVPNLVLSGHVHDYQRIEQTIVDGSPTPFLVTGNGGYHNLHKVDVDVDYTDSHTGATLKAFNCTDWGYITLTIDKNTITGRVTGIDGTGENKREIDTFQYTAKPLKLANSRSVKEL